MLFWWRTGKTKYWERLEMSDKIRATDLCEGCGHCRDRHVIGNLSVTCAVKGCFCSGLTAKTGIPWGHRVAKYIEPAVPEKVYGKPVDRTIRNMP